MGNTVKLCWFLYLEQIFSVDINLNVTDFILQEVLEQ